MYEKREQREHTYKRETRDTKASREKSERGIRTEIDKRGNI